MPELAQLISLGWPIACSLGALALTAGPSGEPYVDALLAERIEPIRARYGAPALAVALVELPLVERNGTASNGATRIAVTGVRAHGTDAEVLPGDRFHLGSCTKAMTATLAAVLVERGAIDWDTSPAEVFGQRFEVDPDWEAVTLELLLAHRGGVVRDASPLWREGETGELRLGLAEELLFAPPQGEPDSATSYSNAGYVIAGAMLEAVTGSSWEDLMRKELFEPLGMDSAGFGAPEAGDDPAAPAQPVGHTPRREPHADFDNPAYYGPCGTVHASLGDWCRFLADQLRGARGHQGLLAPDSYVHLQTERGESYALGWGLATRDWARGDEQGTGLVLSHAGSNTRWYCVVWMAPELGFAAVAATNWADERARKACDEAVWAAIEGQLERIEESAAEDAAGSD